MKRRAVLAGLAALPAAAAPSFSAPAPAPGPATGPAITKGIRELKMVTPWPKGSPGLDSSARRLARLITEASDGHLRVTVFGDGEFVDAFEIFDAVAAGIADMYHSPDYYWQAKVPAFSFFPAVPFGLTAIEVAAWVHRGGGQALWDELSGQFNIKPLLALNTGVQMGGWFAHELTSVADWNGLRCRIPGIGGEVIKHLGAIVVNLPGGEIVPSMRSGAIDAAEWVCPWLDLAYGLHEAAKFYYYPGFHEPGAAVTLGINRKLWDSFTPSERRLIEVAAAAEYGLSLTDFTYENGIALRTLVDEHGVQVRKFSDPILKELGRISEQVLADLGNNDPLTRRVYDSFVANRRRLMDWGEISSRAFYNARSLALG
ncbi:MAG: TRAP transporter substrate-binding protein [Hyphomicrobiales bacterium]|nr:TRAP transporter substrate-binding protein [Hyphomicrobiales bacterium]MCP5372541.1 TRAP transporter substrate-binding protein [Hyphomicrobiales bacterium]